MAKEIDPQDTTRAAAYELWMKAPNPMVTYKRLKKANKSNVEIFNEISEKVHKVSLQEEE